MSPQGIPLLGLYPGQLLGVDWEGCVGVDLSEEETNQGYFKGRLSQSLSASKSQEGPYISINRRVPFGRAQSQDVFIFVCQTVQDTYARKTKD